MLTYHSVPTEISIYTVKVGEIFNDHGKERSIPIHNVNESMVLASGHDDWRGPLSLKSLLGRNGHRKRRAEQSSGEM